MESTAVKTNRHAGVVSAFAVLAYFIAVTERSSLGVAASEAAVRFHSNAAELSALTVFQLAVYAAMQIPVGVLLDRYGSRRMLILGGVLMGAGQLLVSIAPFLAVAVIGRSLLGVGDAFTFISMIRLINHWYAGPSATRRTQFYANIGQLGQVFSAIPFAAFLRACGWSSAYLALALFALIGAGLSFLFVKDSPGHLHDKSVRREWSSLLGDLRTNLRDPAVRMAFWTHFSTQFSGSVFVLLWGYTYLVHAQSVTAPIASTMMASFVAIGFVIGPILSHLCATRPELRPRMVNGVVGSIATTWLAVLLFPGRAPLWLLVILVIVLGAGGPASMIAFDFTRTSVPATRLGTANGFANIGGFVATFVTMFAMGSLLDLWHANHPGDELYSAGGFTLALSFQFVVLAVGIVSFHVERSRLVKRSRE